MKYYHESQRDIPIIDEVDILIVGGGPAGVVAAIAAGRNNSKVMLIERIDFLGGTLTGQILQHISSFHDGQMNQIIGGIPQEIIDRLIQLNGSCGHLKDETGYSSTYTPIDHEKLKYLLGTMLSEAGVKVLLQTLCVGVIIEKGLLKGIIVENKSGRSAIMSKVIIDCSGDADVAYMAGVPLCNEKCLEYLTQPISLLFKVGNVSINEVLDYYERNPNDFRKGSWPRSRLNSRGNITLWGFGRLLKKGFLEGIISLERQEMHISLLPKYKYAIVNVTRFKGNGTDAESLSIANNILRKQIIEFMSFFNKYVPGFGNSYLIETGNTMLGVRETRRIMGEYILKDEDVIKGINFHDAIAKCCFPSDRHDSNDSSMLIVPVRKAVNIPYRCLIPLRIENLLVAGRCISATKLALGSIRVTASCMAMGQAAGTAGALSIHKNKFVRNIDVGILKEVLKKQGAII